jgi:DNA-binding IclR family transcriptional regulator
MSDSEHLKTVERALDVVEYLSQVGEPVRLTDISRSVHLPKSQVHRILVTLLNRKFVQQDTSTLRYFLGINTWRVGQHASLASTILRTARPILDQIFHKESIYLAILDDFQTFYLYIRHGSHPIQAVVPVGGYGPLHATATGMALLAFQSPEYINNYLSKPLMKFTPQTITNSDQLLFEINRIRTSLFSRVTDEFEIDFSGVAVPILDTHNLALAAVGISSPTSRFTAENVNKIVQVALDAARAIQCELGFPCMRTTHLELKAQKTYTFQNQENEYAE